MTDGKTKLLLGIAIVAAWLAPPEARACGGFFCSQVPVDQSGEQLLFSVEDDGTIVAHVMIRYQGAAEDFAWVLPLSSEPEITTGLASIFPTLASLTEPSFSLRAADPVGECTDYWGKGQIEPDSADSGGFAGLEGEGEVEVLQQMDVGPYATSVIRSSDAQALLDWLEDNDYDIPDEALPLIQAYVNIDYVFVALKLLKDRSVGDITPVVLRFPEAGPCIPLRLTAIAATPDMPVTAYMLAPHRVVSTNFLDVELNLAAIDWFDYGSNYRAVVTRAVDEATGLAFVTEYAGSSDVLQNAFYREGQFDFDALRAIEDPAAFVQELLGQGFPRDSQMQGMLRRFIPMPQELADEGVSERDFYNCLECYREWLDEVDFDPGAFVDALWEEIAQPLQTVQEMAERQPYLTRLFTTISAEEMIVDPIFRVNPDLPAVSNRHQAEVQAICEDAGGERRYRLTLPDGTVLVLDPGDPGYPGTLEHDWSDTDGDGVNDDPGEVPEGMPPARRASQLGETGAGEVVLDFGDEIDQVIDDRYSGEVTDESGAPADEAVPHTAAGGGCSIVGAGLGAWPLLLALIVILRRRAV
ncbi:MAG: DUF2330 domain-containing protein [Deltaproteobacteria bacterium]|nr:DUF2330 domain-containing protein [Deltaproteobacteria bacterium]